MSTRNRLSELSHSVRDAFVSLIRRNGAENAKGAPGDSTTSGTSKDAEIYDVSARTEDEFQRFDHWANTLGAYQRSHASLDYRLREAPGVHSLTERLLNDLLQYVRLGSDHASAENVPATTRSETSDSSDEGEGPPWHEIETFSSALIGSMSSTIDRLYRISFHIRNPTNRPNKTKAATFKDIDPDTDVDVFECYGSYDLENVVETFSSLRSAKRDKTLNPTSTGDEQEEAHIDAASSNVSESERSSSKELAGAVSLEDDYLVLRLSRANVMRRRQFRYWWHRREKRWIAEQSSPSPKVPTDARIPTENEDPEANSQKIPPSIPSTATKFVEKGLDIDDAKSVSSSETYALIKNEPDREELTFPPFPAHLRNKKEFPCPFCHDVFPQSLSRKSAWETHVLRDLRPYVCTFADCVQPDQPFDSLQSWVGHELNNHNLVSRSEMRIDLEIDGVVQGVHQDISPGLPASLVSELIARDCPVCLQQNRSTAHIASHLQRIALFSLPGMSAEEDEDEKGLDRSESVVAALSTVASDQSGSVERELEFDEERIECSICGNKRVAPDLVACHDCEGLFCKELHVERYDISVSSGPRPGTRTRPCWQEHAANTSHRAFQNQTSVAALSRTPGLENVQKAGILLNYLDESDGLPITRGSSFDNKDNVSMRSSYSDGRPIYTADQSVPEDADIHDKSNSAAFSVSLLPSTYSAVSAGDSAAAAGASNSSNAQAFSEMLDQYNQLQQQTMAENLEMQKAQAFWNPLDSMSKRDATS